jgi:hypothetical protein
MELLPKEEYKKYSGGFEIDYLGNRYYVDPYEGSVKKIEIRTGKPIFSNWEDYVNIRERDPSKFKEMVAKRKMS